MYFRTEQGASLVQRSVICTHLRGQAILMVASCEEEQTKPNIQAKVKQTNKQTKSNEQNQTTKAREIKQSQTNKVGQRNKVDETR